jgi:hypothetical protein
VLKLYCPEKSQFEQLHSLSPKGNIFVTVTQRKNVQNKVYGTDKGNLLCVPTIQIKLILNKTDQKLY